MNVTVSTAITLPLYPGVARSATYPIAPNETPYAAPFLQNIKSAASPVRNETKCTKARETRTIEITRKTKHSAKSGNILSAVCETVGQKHDLNVW